MDLSNRLMAVYEILRGAFGHRDWWPAQTPFEVIVGAILTQNTNWTNVEKAIGRLQEAGLLDPHALAACGSERLQEAIRPSGYFRQKAARLRRVAEWLIERCDGDIPALETVPTEQLREDLISLRGVGPETADSILLYALGRPVFVVDTYTFRVMGRHGLAEPECGYHGLQDLFHSHLPVDVGLYGDFHAQFVEVGKRFCRPQPRCDECPLHGLLGDPLADEFAP
jgi:endonuclease-3 related protein